MGTKERLVMESMFRVVDKDGQDVDFLLNNVQLSLDSNLTGRDIVPKARQEGVSTYFLARGLVKCLGQRNTRAVVISHDTEATQRMLGKVHYFLANLRGPGAQIKTASKNELSFPKTNSHFYIGTAGSRKFGRGDTITYLHCSEVAFWENASNLLAGLFQAVPMSGDISLESTGNGQGNYYHRACMRAAQGKGRYRLHFFSWLDSTEYYYKLTPEEEAVVLANLDPDLDEHDLIKFPGVTAGHIAWRRDKLDELDYDLKKFKQEYPLTLDECFQASGQGLFSKVWFVKDLTWGKIGDDATTRLSGLPEHPKPSLHYAIGADVGAGVGADRSVAEIICIEEMEQVAEWASDGHEPDVFGRTILPALGSRYNNAYISVEKNNHGILTIAELRKVYPDHLHYHVKPSKDNGEEMKKLQHFGVATTAVSKPYLIGALRKLLKDQLRIHSAILKDELNSFVEKENGRLEAEEGCYDDRVMAMAICIHGFTKAMMAFAEEDVIDGEILYDPFTLEGIVAELTKSRGEPSEAIFTLPHISSEILH